MVRADFAKQGRHLPLAEQSEVLKNVDHPSKLISIQNLKPLFSLDYMKTSAVGTITERCAFGSDAQQARHSANDPIAYVGAKRLDTVCG